MSSSREKSARAKDAADRRRIDRGAGASPSERELGAVGVSGIGSSALLASAFNRSMFGDIPLEGMMEALIDLSSSVSRGDLEAHKELLTCQAVVLDKIFAEMARRAAANMGHNLETVEAYMRVALKAQTQCRTTIEALDRMTLGRVQPVRHVHLDNRGGHAIVAETFHAGGGLNARSLEQPHAQRAFGAPLPSEDTGRGKVPIPRNQGQTSLPNARRERKRCAGKKP